MSRTALRALHVVMALLFAWSMALQYNDPDLLPWIAVYGAALVVAVSGAIGAPLRWQSSVLAMLAFAWAMALSPAVPTFLHADGPKTNFYMKTGDAVEEEARECGGLLIVSFWSVVTLVDANARLRRSGRAT